MRDIPPTVSEEQLYRGCKLHHIIRLTQCIFPGIPHAHSTLHLLLTGDGSGHLYIHYRTMVTTVPHA